MRVFSGGIATETNTFAPMPTGMASFKDRGYFPAGKHPDHFNFFAGPLWAARLRGKERGWVLINAVMSATIAASSIGVTFAGGAPRSQGDDQSKLERSQSPTSGTVQSKPILEA